MASTHGGGSGANSEEVPKEEGVCAGDGTQQPKNTKWPMSSIRFRPAVLPFISVAPLHTQLRPLGPYHLGCPLRELMKIAQLLTNRWLEPSFGNMAHGCYNEGIPHRFPLVRDQALAD